jgi:TonB family protein
MKKHAVLLLFYFIPFLSFSQGVKANQFDKFLKKHRVELEPVTLSGLPPKNKLDIAYAAVGTTMYMNMSGYGWGTKTVDNGDELMFLLGNDSTITLKATSLQSFEPGLSQNTYKHQFYISTKDLNALSEQPVKSIRKYSFESYSDLKIPAENTEKLKRQATLFMAELKKANVFKSIQKIDVKDIRQHIGDSVSFCSKVYKTRFYEASANGPTLLDVQADFTDPFINVVILKKDRWKFGNAPEKRYINKDVCISGVVTLLNDIPYIQIQEREQIKMLSPVSLAEVDLFEGDSISILGKVFTARYLEDSKTKPTLLNVGAPFPDQPLTLVIENEDRKNFDRPEEVYLNKVLRVSGKVASFKGKPQIVLHSMDQVEILPDDTPVPSFVSAVQTTTVKPVAKENTTQSKAVNSAALFPGGDAAFYQFLREQLVNPDQLQPNEQRRVVASFSIDASGSCSDIVIVESAGYVFDEEVKRVLLKMPKWKPAVKDGNAVSSRMTQPISFTNAQQNRPIKP